MTEPESDFRMQVIANPYLDLPVGLPRTPKLDLLRPTCSPGGFVPLSPLSADVLFCERVQSDKGESDFLNQTIDSRFMRTRLQSDLLTK